MRHDAAWYAELGAILGHRGYVTLAEIRQEEARQARAQAATARWTRRGGSYHLDLDLNYYLVQREPGRATWQVSAWPSGQGQERYVRRQYGISTMAGAKAMALAQPCSRCGLASPLPFMTPVLPERPGQRTGPRPAFRCMDTPVCEAERTRLTTGHEIRMETRVIADILITNTATGESASLVIDPAAFTPDCPNSMIEKLT